MLAALYWVSKTFLLNLDKAGQSLKWIADLEFQAQSNMYSAVLMCY